jgi:FkbM family methyltransferase
MEFLAPGMVFWDVGAHIGEFSVIAARQDGETGRVDAFEPHPQVAQLFGRNIQFNRFLNLALHHHAITNRLGVVEFVLDREPSMSHLRMVTTEKSPARTVNVSTVSLSSFCEACGYTPHLIKVDVEGAEKLVLDGAQNLLRRPAESAPVWITEFAVENCSRYEYHPSELLNEFERHGYRNYWLTLAGLIEMHPSQGSADDSIHTDRCVIFVSAKDENRLKFATRPTADAAA